ncbi:hypothetical protein ACFWG7_31465 [Streptomyces koyangensis]|uniref:RapZ C-terminal domain-containing protein n=1 Tax=Streptomyces TaxID=1883 RepID=UPI0035ABFECC
MSWSAPTSSQPPVPGRSSPGPSCGCSPSPKRSRCTARSVTVTCQGGRHRSVAVAEEVAQGLDRVGRSAGWTSSTTTSPIRC